MDDIVIDDVASHQGADLRQLIERVEHLFEYLQVYPPNFNSIERQWAQIPFVSSTKNCSIEDRFAHFSVITPSRPQLTVPSSLETIYSTPPTVERVFFHPYAPNLNRIERY